MVYSEQLRIQFHMNKLNLAKLLSLAGDRMSRDLKEQLISHPGELGTEREEVLRSFLRLHLPKRFEVSTGFIFDSAGNLSKQLDIIVADSLVCPRFETAGGKRIYPCECVVAVGQVRSSITSVSALNEALLNLHSAKDLDRSAKGNAIDKKYDEWIDNRENYLHQIFTFVFVTGKSLSLNSIKPEMLNYISSHEPHLWTNVIFALDQYLVTFCCEDGVCPNPMHARGISFQSASSRQDILLRFYKLLGRAIEVTRVSGLPYWQYLEGVGEDWDVDVWHSMAEYPPPLLRDL